jgi:predicted transcriptional regulator
VNSLAFRSLAPAAAPGTSPQSPSRRPFTSSGSPFPPIRPQGAVSTRSPVAPAAVTATAFLQRVERARASLDAALAEADAHRFAQTVEIAARGVEHGVQSLRQALQAQV